MANTMWIIKTTLPATWREFEVTSFAQSLLESGAACIQHHQITSNYKWEGKINSEQEWAVEIKVSQSNKQSLIDKITELHPHDVPQIIMIQCEATKEYGDWVNLQ